ncbi:MAG: FHA domain-containing protein [Myxococcota bacterium]
MSLGASRVFRRGPQSSTSPRNDATIVGTDGLLATDTERGFDAESLFKHGYEVLQAVMKAHAELGVLIVAFDPKGRPMAQGWLRASLDKTRAAIVGRHSACDLALSSAERDVSLRHLMVIVRATSHSEVRIRILDLHTARGFTDEHGEVLSAAVADGPLFIGLDGVRLVALVTGEPLLSQAEHAYAAIPPRVLFEEHKGTVGQIRRPGGAQPSFESLGQTIIRSIDGPVAAASELRGEDEMQEGTLIIRGARTMLRRAVGPRALARGILVGRYDRCAVGIDTRRLSRVHFLIVRDGDDIVGIDTASTNGTWLGEREVSLIRLEDGLSLSLAQALQITWHCD